MKTLAASLSILTREGVMLYLLRGVAFTCIISVLGVIMGLIVGSLLALARTRLPRFPLHDVDLLLLDEVGKNISGSGYDPNIFARPASWAG